MAIETPHGTFWIDPLTQFGTVLSRDGNYESAMGLTIADFLKPGMIFLDMGANEGFFTVMGAKLCGPHGRVVAVEPQNRMIPIIRENLRLNGLNNVSIVNAAVSDTIGTGTIYLFPDINTGASGVTYTPHYRVPTQAVPTRALTQILDDADLPHVDLMKVDIEGSEWEMIHGSLEAFSTHRIRSMTMEIHNGILQRRGLDGAELVRKLDSCGYRIDKTHGPWVWTVD
jgi:FkbM family methyltransferase